MTTGTGPERMHPLSPLLRGLRAFWFVIAAVSWQGFARLGLSRGALLVAAVGVLGLAWSWLTWYTTGYEVRDGELRIVDGVLTRSRRTIPIARLQAVDVVRPFLARIAGLAELRLEVAGGTRTEAPLAYLTLTRAHDLRRELLATAATGREPDPTAPAPDTEPALVSVPTARLIAAQLRTPQILGLPIALAATIGLFVIDPDLSLLGLAGTITAVAGIVLQPVREALVNYAFTARVRDGGLRIRHGLFEQRQQTLPLRRVVAVRLTAPLLWRGRGWLRASVASAAYAAGAERVTGRALLPVGTREEGAAVLTAVLPEATAAAPVWRGVPPRARWCAPWQWPRLAVAVTDEVYSVRSGRFTRHIVHVRRDRIQSVRVAQGRWQRVFGLATVHVDVAGAAGMTAAARCRPAAEAVRLAWDLSRPARPARSR